MRAPSRFLQAASSRRLSPARQSPREATPNASITVDQQGRLTAASTGTGSATTSYTGDAFKFSAVFRNTSGTVTQIGTTANEINKQETRTRFSVFAVSGTNVTISGTRNSTTKWALATLVTTVGP